MLDLGRKRYRLFGELTECHCDIGVTSLFNQKVECHLLHISDLLSKFSGNKELWCYPQEMIAAKLSR